VPAADPFVAAPLDIPQAVAKAAAINALNATPAVARPGRFMIGVMIVNMVGGVAHRFAAISGGELPANLSDMAKLTLGIAAAATLAPITLFAAKRPAAQAPVNWAGVGVALVAPINPLDNPLDNCAAPKMLHSFYATVAAPNRVHPANVASVEITEQWFNPSVPDQPDAWQGLTEPSCRTCQTQVPVLTCGY
jgi:hypothetical protein